MAGRHSLPHDPPPWIDPADAIWFITICALPRGEAQLTRAEVARAIFESVEFRYHRHEWYPWLFVVMPDHCHALISITRSVRSLKKRVSDWKHWLAAKYHVNWQRDFFDHRLREEESFSEKAEYIRMNPVRAGLVLKPEDWPWIWTPPDGTPFTGFGEA